MWTSILQKFGLLSPAQWFSYCEKQSAIRLKDMLCTMDIGVRYSLGNRIAVRPSTKMVLHIYDYLPTEQTIDEYRMLKKWVIEEYTLAQHYPDRENTYVQHRGWSLAHGPHYQPTYEDTIASVQKSNSFWKDFSFTPLQKYHDVGNAKTTLQFFRLVIQKTKTFKASKSVIQSRSNFIIFCDEYWDMMSPLNAEMEDRYIRYLIQDLITLHPEAQSLILLEFSSCDDFYNLVLTGNDHALYILGTILDHQPMHAMPLPDIST